MIEGQFEAEDDGEFGPAMLALTERQRKFVLAVVAMGRNGIKNLAQAAREAGYSDHKEHCKVKGHLLSHDARIQAALLEESKKRINVAAAIVATPVAIEIALNKSAKHSDRLRAAEMLFNRGGIPSQTEHHVTVEHRHPQKMLELAKRFAAELGVDEARLIGVNRAAAPVLDGEFTEVETK